MIRGSGGMFYDAGLLNPALLHRELGGMTFGGFSFQSLPRGGSFFNNPALNAFGPLQAGGTRFLANPDCFSYILPAGTTALERAHLGHRTRAAVHHLRPARHPGAESANSRRC